MKMRSMMISSGLLIAAAFPVLAQDAGLAGQVNASAQAAQNVQGQGVNSNANANTGVGSALTTGQNNQPAGQVNAGTSTNAGLQAGSTGIAVQNSNNANVGTSGALINPEVNASANGDYGVGQAGVTGQYGAGSQYGVGNQYGGSILNTGVAANTAMDGSSYYGSSSMGVPYGNMSSSNGGSCCSNTSGYSHSRRGHFHRHRRCR